MIDALPNYQYLKKSDINFYHLKILEHLLRLAELLASLEGSKVSSNNIEYLSSILQLVDILEHIQQSLHPNMISQHQREHLTSLLSAAQTLTHFTALLNQYTMLQQNGQKLSSNKSQLLEQLAKSHKTVICPVKGEVLYHEKGCISTHD